MRQRTSSGATLPPNSHVVRKHVNLTVVTHPQFTPLPGVPPTLADCPTGVCPFVRCRHHLWRIDSEDRSGRPGIAHVPRGERGRTISAPGHAGDERAPTTLSARWLEDPIPESCALRLAAQGPRDNTEVGHALGRHRTLAALIVKQAIRKFVANGGTEEGLNALIEEEEAKRHAR